MKNRNINQSNAQQKYSPPKYHDILTREQFDTVVAEVIENLPDFADGYSWGGFTFDGRRMIDIEPIAEHDGFVYISIWDLDGNYSSETKRGIKAEPQWIARTIALFTDTPPRPVDWKKTNKVRHIGKFTHVPPVPIPAPEPKLPRGTVEKDIENWFCEILALQNIPYKQQVKCAAGIADIVTGDTIYEVKLILNRSVLFHAMGQLMAYRACLNDKAEIVVVYGRVKDRTEVERLAQAANVKLIQVKGKP